MGKQDFIYFHTRDPFCKHPFGAVRTDRKLTFRLSVSRRMAPREVTLVWGRENEPLKEYRMDWVASEKGRDTYRVILPLMEQGLYQYFFKLYTAVSQALCGAPGVDENGEGILCYDRCNPFTVTVYDAAFQPPKWFGEGVTYQIFPDRFASSGEIPDLPGRRIIKNRLEMPCRKEEPNGDVKNNYFYGGNLQGIIEKLDYLESLGVRTIYLNPIFSSESNHRYDTADYMRIDPLLGTEEDFEELCRKAKEHHIRIMLDGVFNHTGNNSIYFNQNHSYPGKGASQGKESPYYTWYRFKQFPDEYECWWGIKILPAVNENEPSFRNFIYGGKDSVVRKWLRAGASAWRLDVADELPDDFIQGIRKAMREEKKDAFLLGEVWEDASLKIAYGKRREYFQGSELDGVMNYPFRNAVLSFLLEKKAEDYQKTVESIEENYPYPALRSLMNLLGTHDTPRILTVLGAEKNLPENAEARAKYRLSEKERKTAEKRLKIASMLLFTHIGSPTVYYGDECGMQGLEDPCNRAWFVKESEELLDWYRKLSQVRSENSLFSHRHATVIEANGSRLCLNWNDKLALFCNAGESPEEFKLNAEALDLMTGERYTEKTLKIAPISAVLVRYTGCGGK